MKKLTMICAALVCLAAAPAFAQTLTPPTICGTDWATNSVIQPSTVISGNVDVPVGAMCTLYGEVQGNVTVEGFLSVQGGAKVDNSVYVVGGQLNTSYYNWIVPANNMVSPQIGGDVVITNAVSDMIQFTSISGNLTISGNAGASIVQFSKVGQSAQFANNAGSITLMATTIGQNLSFSSNTGLIALSYNTINHNLTCGGNTLVPSGVGDVFGKQTNGQCSAVK
jgi:hypothetical protein